MTNINQRIIQILSSEEPLSTQQLVELVRTKALSEDSVVLSDDRISKHIESQIRMHKVIQDEEALLYINNSQNQHLILKQQSITIKHYPTGHEMSFGGTGNKFSNTEMTFGNIDTIKANINDYFFTIDIDLPLRLEINEQLKEPYNIKIEKNTYSLFHKIKKRGEELFSCTDTTYIPYFSSLQIVGLVDIDFLQRDKIDLLTSILTKINSIINNKDLEKILEEKHNLPFQICYLKKSDKDNENRQSVCATIVYITTEIEILGKKLENEYPKEELRKLLNSEKIVLQNKFENDLSKYTNLSDFSQKIFILTHDFSYFIRQTPEVFSNMKEELIRDVYLFCTRVGTEYNCEAESFIYDGKADFKIKPNNSYEYIVGEFKWWNGENSIQELCMQGFEKHVTGQEKDIFLLMLSDRNDVNIPIEKSLSYIKSRPEILSEENDILPKGSKEYFYKFKAKIKNNEVNIIFGVIDLHYSRV